MFMPHSSSKRQHAWNSRCVPAKGVIASKSLKIVWRILIFSFALAVMNGDTFASSPQDPDVLLLQEAYKTLKKKFKIGNPIGPIQGDHRQDSRRIKASQMYKTEDGKAYVLIEVHRLMNTTLSPEIWICAPRMGMGGKPAVYHWFMYGKVEPDGPIVSKEHYSRPFVKHSPPPDVPIPPLTNSGDWCGSENYGFWEVILKGFDEDPPHWSPILTYPPNQGAFFIPLIIYTKMQNPKTRGEALASLNEARPCKPQDVPGFGNMYLCVDLTDRAMDTWPATVLRGLVVHAGWPGGDFVLDHTTWYHDGKNAPHKGLDDVLTGGPLEESDPNWPGLDWDMAVEPDPDLTYLASEARSNVGVEIEHFAVPEKYRPQTGEWLQTAGRWIMDCGHIVDGFNEDNGFYTEIHPPELMVATKMLDGKTSEARIIVTGASFSQQHFFVVYPPPRPSPDAVLKYSVVEDERKGGAYLKLTPVPNNDIPNHFVGSITNETPGHLLLYNTGMVGMSPNLGYQGVVRCWWEIPTSTIGGLLALNNKPTKGAFVFYRDSELENSSWQNVRVDNDGKYSINGLYPGRSYWFRPAGSGWDFKNVPKLVTIKPGFNDVSFRETKDLRISAHYSQLRVVSNNVIAALQPHRKEYRTIEAGKTPQSAYSIHVDPSVLKRVADPNKAERQNEALEKIQSMLVKFSEPPSIVFGVRNNGFNHPDSGTIYFHLDGMVDKDDKPTPDLWSAYSVWQFPYLDEKINTHVIEVIKIDGNKDIGVAKASIHAKLLLGNDAVGYRLVQEIHGQTDALGNAGFRFMAGTHCEETLVSLEVTNNPFNPWFLPKIRSKVFLFQPAKTGDDFGNQVPYQLKGIPVIFSKKTITTVEGDAHLFQFEGHIKESRDAIEAHRKFRALPSQASMVKLAPRVVIPPPAKEVDLQQFIQLIENANIKMQEFPIIDIEKISVREREHSGTGRPSISTQDNWRWCKKCQGLFFAGNPTLGVCSAGDAHDKSESGNYNLVRDTPTASGQQNWRWCKKCQGLFFAGNPSTGFCPARGGHDHTESGNYSLIMNTPTAPGQQNWRWCKKCQGLFFAGNSTLGICPAERTHDQSESGNYTLIMK